MQVKSLLWFSGKENRLSKNYISSSFISLCSDFIGPLDLPIKCALYSPPTTEMHIIYLQFNTGSLKTQTGNVFSVGLFNPIVHFMEDYFRKFQDTPETSPIRSWRNRKISEVFSGGASGRATKEGSKEKFKCCLCVSWQDSPNEVVFSRGLNFPTSIQ